MVAAVLYGTGKRSLDAGGDEMPAGKTGTCSDQISHVGWFLTYADEANPKIALAVLIRGNSSRIKGPLAAGVAGHIYRRLREQNYFAQSSVAKNLATISSGHLILFYFAAIYAAYIFHSRLLIHIFVIHLT